jgi:Lysylphosphatidylglycerol synthase TM region
MTVIEDARVAFELREEVWPQDRSMSPIVRRGGHRLSFEQGLRRLGRSASARLALVAGSGTLALALSLLAAHRFADTPLPLSRGDPSLLTAAGLLFLVAYALKIYAWRLLFAVDERPQTRALAAATGGASIVGLVLPGRCTDVVRVAIVNRYPGCPAGLRTLCLSIVVLGLIDIAALAPLALALAVVPGYSSALRTGLILLAGVGFAAAAFVAVLPRMATRGRIARSRAGRWLRPRTTSLRVASGAWALVSVSWLVRTVALLLLLGALGVGFSFALAVLYLSAGAAVGALPGPAGATKAGAGAAALIASGVGTSQALDVALAGQALGVLCGVAILLYAAAWHVSHPVRADSGRGMIEAAPPRATGSPQGHARPVSA